MFYVILFCFFHNLKLLPNLFTFSELIAQHDLVDAAVKSVIKEDVVGCCNIMRICKGIKCAILNAYMCVGIITMFAFPGGFRGKCYKTFRIA